MALAPNKTKLVCTLGPASESPEILRQMLLAGMNVARLNFAHGEPAWHQTVIDNVRAAAAEVGRRVTIMADLPGPKLRIGRVAPEPLMLAANDAFTLTTNDIVGDQHRVSVTFARLPAVVRPGALLSLNDGNIQLEVVSVAGPDVVCRVLVGGELRSHKGLNLPGIDLGVGAFTAHDREWLAFALAHGVDAISQSFVETAADLIAVREAAAALGGHPFIIAKIERAGALTHIDELLGAADGIMVARGDLGVETPLERIAVVQQQLIRQANLLGKPVITATQMLESMVDHRLPTRAEATDVANAILDGTDCVMLSEESAMGQYPVAAVTMLAKIAAATEPSLTDVRAREIGASYDRGHDVHFVDLISRSVQRTVAHVAPAAVIVPTATGHIARMVSRFKLPVWVAAVSRDQAICRGLEFSYGICPVHVPDPPNEWGAFARGWVSGEGLAPDLVVLAECPSMRRPRTNPTVAILDLRLGDGAEG